MGAISGYHIFAGVATATAVGARGANAPGPRSLHPAPREEIEGKVREGRIHCAGSKRYCT